VIINRRSRKTCAKFVKEALLNFSSTDADTEVLAIQRDLPLAILVSLIACAVLYVGVSLVVTGMVPYYALDGAAPLASAFIDRGLVFMSTLISVGAVAGLTTTVLVGLYVQVRDYSSEPADYFFV
jgi:amino acid transporter